MKYEKNRRVVVSYSIKRGFIKKIKDLSRDQGITASRYVENIIKQQIL